MYVRASRRSIFTVACLRLFLLRLLAAHLLLASVQALDAFEAIASLGESAPLDLAAEELRTAANELGRITGRIEVEELLDVIFRDFCIGK